MAPNPSLTTAEEVSESDQSWFSVHPPESIDDAWLAWESSTGQMLVIRQPAGNTYVIELYADSQAETKIGEVTTVHDGTYDGTNALASARRFRA